VIAVNADPDVLEKLRIVGGPKLVRELVELFLKYAPERLTAARQSIEAGEVSGAQRALHSLKSSAGQLGMSGIQETCSRGEASAARGDAVGAGAALAQIEAGWPETKAWLTEQMRLV
jgi:HPt (histidine-containing phosphotransfer) domain-containing protein